MRKSATIFTTVLVLAIMSPIARAAQTPIPTTVATEPVRGPHGGQVVENKASKFEVKLDPNSSHIEIFNLKPAEKASRPRSVTLYRDTDTSQTIELKAADPRDEFPRFEGELAPNAGSFVGFELKFGIDLKALTVLPYIPYIAPRQGDSL